MNNCKMAVATILFFFLSFGYLYASHLKTNEKLSGVSSNARYTYESIPFFTSGDGGVTFVYDRGSLVKRFRFYSACLLLDDGTIIFYRENDSALKFPILEMDVLKIWRKGRFVRTLLLKDFLFSESELPLENFALSWYRKLEFTDATQKTLKIATENMKIWMIDMQDGRNQLADPMVSRGFFSLDKPIPMEEARTLVDKPFLDFLNGRIFNAEIDNRTQRLEHFSISEEYKGCTLELTMNIEENRGFLNDLQKYIEKLKVWIDLNAKGETLYLQGYILYTQEERYTLFSPLFYDMMRVKDIWLKDSFDARRVEEKRFITNAKTYGLSSGKTEIVFTK